MAAQETFPLYGDLNLQLRKHLLLLLLCLISAALSLGPHHQRELLQLPLAVVFNSPGDLPLKVASKCAGAEFPGD